MTNQWNKLMQYIPGTQENLEGHRNIKLHLEGDIYVITSDIQGLIQGYNLTIDQWTKFLTVMESYHRGSE